MSTNENPEVSISELDKLEIFVTKHWKRIIWVSVTIVVLATAGVLVNDYVTGVENRSAGAISNAESEEELKEVIADEAAYKGVFSAQLKLAKLKLDEKKYEEVAAVYAEILNSSAQDVVKNRVRLNDAALEEVLGNSDASLAKYEAIASDALVSEVAKTEAEYSVARLKVAKGEVDQAKVILSKLKDAETNSFWKTQADLMLKRL